MALFVLLTFIHWIAIYLLDSIIQPLNNWVLEIIQGARQYNLTV